ASRSKPAPVKVEKGFGNLNISTSSQEDTKMEIMPVLPDRLRLGAFSSGAVLDPSKIGFGERPTREDAGSIGAGLTFLKRSAEVILGLPRYTLFQGEQRPQHVQVGHFVFERASLHH